MNFLEKLTSESNLLPIDASNILDNFTEINLQLKTLNEEVEQHKANRPDIMTKEYATQAKTLDKKFIPLSKDNTKIHKTIKADYLNRTRFMDKVRNFFRDDIDQTRSDLKKDYKYFEILEEKQKQELNLQRIEEVKEYVEIQGDEDFSNMDSFTWKAFVQAHKSDFENKLKVEKEEKEARQAEKLRVEKLEKENQKLKLEQKEIEKTQQLNEKLEQDKTKLAEKLKQTNKFIEFLESLNLTKQDIDGEDIIMKNQNGKIKLYKKLGEYDI